MRLRRLSLLAVVTIVAACGSAGAPSTGTNATPRATAAASAPSATATSAGTGTVDCAAIKTAAAELLKIQLLAQMRTPDAVESIKTRTFGDLDLDAFLGAMHALHALDGVATPLGDPKAAITTYEDAAQAAKVLFAVDPLTQSAIDTYNTHVGTVGDFLGHQIAIAGALDAAGC